MLDDSTLMEQLKELEASTSLEPFELPGLKLDLPPAGKYPGYHEYLSQLEAKDKEYQVIIGQTQFIGQDLNQIIENISGISLRAHSFKENVGKLSDEYHNLDRLQVTISKDLTYFENLDPIQRKLNHSSSANVVRKDSFKSMMVKIDESLEFIEANPNFKESEAYRIRFKQCLIRSCSLISNYLSNFLRNLQNDITQRVSQTQANSSARDALLYNKFSSDADIFQALVNQIIARVTKKSNIRYYDELSSILRDCYDHYFSVRFKLLHPSIWSQLDQTILKDKETPLVKFIQDNLLYFTQLCTKEYTLFTKFFPKSEKNIQINNWLTQLCEPLYDCVRTRILREFDISSLCDAVTLLSKYYQFEEDSQEYELQFKDVQFDKIFKPIIQDIQSRLVFRVQVYVDTNIVRYKPTKDVFMISNRKIPSVPTSSDNNGRDEMVESFIESFTAVDENGNEFNQMKSYYPPLVRALALLSKIYQMVNSSVFDDLAHHIVHDCIESLETAYALVQKQSTSTLDTRLSYLKNMLMLRDQVQHFDIQYISNETYLDFSGLGGLIRSIREHKVAKVDSYSVLNLARESVPKVVNNMVDARSELMVELRNVINDFTERASKEIIQDTFVMDKDLLSENLRLRENVEKILPRIHTQIVSFIGDKEVVTHLIDAIQELVVQSYATYYEKLSEKTEDDKVEKSKLSELMYVDVFADFFNNVASKLFYENDQQN